MLSTKFSNDFIAVSILGASLTIEFVIPFIFVIFDVIGE